MGRIILFACDYGLVRTKNRFAGRANVLRRDGGALCDGGSGFRVLNNCWRVSWGGANTACAKA
jgi:hypothetical protein